MLRETLEEKTGIGLDQREERMNNKGTHDINSY